MKIELLSSCCLSFSKKQISSFCTMFLCGILWGQINMSTTGNYSQDFNTLKNSGTTNTWVDNSTLQNWYASSFNSSYIADNGSSTAGGLKSYGTGTNSERALGSLGSSSANPAYGVVLRNTSATTITDIKVSFTGEQWRNGGNTAVQQLSFYYAKSTNSITSVTSGIAGYTSVSALNFSSKINTSTASALDGNVTANRTVISNVSIPNVNLAAGDYIILKWDDINDSGNDHGLAIDDVNVAWTVTPTCTAPVVSSTTSASNLLTTSADLTASLTSIGGANVTEEGFDVSSASNLSAPTRFSNTGLSVSTVPHTISKSVSGLTPNTLYYYASYATNSCTSPQTSYSHSSGYPSFTTLSLAPVSAPADNILTNSFRANWTAPTGQGSVSYTYHLEIDDNSDFSSLIYNDETLTSTNFTQASLSAGTNYYYRVRVKNTSGYSAWSSTQTVTTSASNKPVVTASSFNGTVNVSFSQNIQATNIPDSYAIAAGSNLPAGLTLNTTTGAITGIPTVAGNFTTNVTATKLSETSDPVTISFTIAKGNQTITGLPVALTKIYGDADYSFSATASSNLEVTYTSSNNAVATVTGNTVKIVGVGNVTITAHQTGDANWNAAPDVSQALTVNPKEITITGLSAESKVYDQTNSVVITGTPVYSGLVNGDAYAVTGTVTWAFANKNAGTNKTLVQTGSYDTPSPNYTLLQPVLQSSISKKNIAITSITANSRAYNGSVTATFSNVASTDVFSGDVVTFAVSGSFSDANAGVDKDVTVLAVDISGTDGGNYNIPLFPTDLKADITKANQTITFTTLPTVNVGTSVNLSTYASTTSGLTLSYNSSAPGVASISGTSLTGNNAGTTVVTVSQNGNVNYNPATSVQQTVTVVELPIALAQWDFFGLSSAAVATTVTAQNISSELNSGSATLTRGPGAAYSAGSNSFRTVGFQNDGIATTNTDYFQTSFTATSDILSLTSVRARVIGTSTYVTSPGVDVQFAYSFSPNSNYVLINSPSKVVGNVQIPDVNLSSVAALQNVSPGTTVYFRFYASGQTSTGGYGFSSTASGEYGLEFYGRFKSTEIIWDGTSWSNFNGPDESQDATIDGAFIQTSTNNPLEVKNLNITNNGSLTIQANQGVIVNGDITMPDDKIIIESDGSLVQTKITDGNSPNTIIAKRIVNMRTSDYTYWSSPVANQVLLNTQNSNAANSTGGFSEGSPNNRTYEYNEVNDTFKATTDQQFVSAKGYAIRGKSTYGTDLSSDELNFRGNLHNGDYSIQIQKSKNTLVGSVSTEHGYNLVGNPYPSNIDFDKLYDLDNGTGTKNSALILGKAWFWTNVPGAPTTQGGSAYTANNYATYSLAGGVPATGSDAIDSPIPTKFIKVAQGFIVQMRTAAPTVTTPDFGILKFDNTIRSNNSSSYFYNNNKDTNNELNRYWVKLVAPNNVVNTILLAHLDNATNDYDPDYDSELLTVGDDSFYSKLNAQKLQIQARNNPLNNNDVINLGTKYSMNGTYKIKLVNREGVFKANQKIYLLDKLNNTYTDITSQDYSFTASKGLDENRFEIVYKSNEVLGTDSTKKSDFTVYRDGQEFVITSSKALGKVEVYDAAGRLVVSLKTNNEKNIRLDAATLTNGVYIIKAENSGNVKTKKIIK